jgi:hypothetical protein
MVKSRSENHGTTIGEMMINILFAIVVLFASFSTAKADTMVALDTGTVEIIYDPVISTPTPNTFTMKQLRVIKQNLVAQKQYWVNQKANDQAQIDAYNVKIASAQANMDRATLLGVQ